MAIEKIQLTLEGKAKLEKELDTLINVERPKNIEDIQAARAQGDLSENADYDAARKEQARIEGRIQEIKNMLENAKIIDVTPTSSKVVSLGSTVTILDLSDNEEATYRIVGTVESDPDNGLISNSSPLGAALIGYGVGDEVVVKVAKEYRVRILSLNK